MLASMIHAKKNDGFILILTLLIVAGATAIVTYIFNRGSVQIPFVHTMINRHKAQLLALSGIEVACAQLSFRPEKKESEPVQKNGVAQPQKTDPKLVAAKALLATLLPTLNRWQTFTLTEAADGIDATLELCIMCEEGKINLNQIFDFATEKFKNEGKPSGDWKALFQLIAKKIETISGVQNIAQSVVTYFKKREKQKLDDVTELLLIKEFAPFKNNIYYQPPASDEKNKKKVLYLTDIFTTHSSESTLQPWFFSDALCTLLEIKGVQTKDAERKKNSEQWAKNLKLNADWKKDWTTALKPIYEKELQSLPKGIDSVLSTYFDPKIFSVRVHATVGQVTQHLFAIIERTSRSQNGELVYDGEIKKIYWL